MATRLADTATITSFRTNLLSGALYKIAKIRDYVHLARFFLLYISHFSLNSKRFCPFAS
ncbi:hypothetical protein BGZ61DRAFT_468201 [Ilyonectria robusta]|uniref:uncharacterized protein n=1 Tax=Ilyonectria robusta TaxID=1079257 RepID=UPI001E8E3ACE|nr:uncharacterized protein BGZ61DRAFT_468201 [Ilyonectria robusta]KAH8652996.1 hypothetical protein BGZ61DRAFT_468201 [Ilyonectria robusta]